MPRRHGRSRRRAIPVPPNDPYNFFFPNDDCGKFSFRAYNCLPNVVQSSYTREEAQAFVDHVNTNFVTSGWLGLGLVCGWISLHMFFTMSGNFNLIFYNMFLFFFLICFMAFLQCRNNRKLQEFLAGKNAELQARGVHWAMHPSGRYLHLCNQYPQFFNPNGGWQQNPGQMQMMAQPQVIIVNQGGQPQQGVPPMMQMQQQGGMQMPQQQMQNPQAKMAQNPQQQVYPGQYQQPGMMPPTGMMQPGVQAPPMQTGQMAMGQQLPQAKP